MTRSIQEIMQTSPVIPVIVIRSLESAVPLANALVEGGLKVLEITLRTRSALDAIRAIKTDVPGAIIGAGTIIDTKSLDQAINAGAEFLVSPGTTSALLDAAVGNHIPILPGVTSPSEVMRVLERGLTAMKFFPAEAAGGIPMLKAIAGPLPQATFCPTGGICLENAQHYLDLENVACVGGSWITPARCTELRDWKAITRLASQAAKLGPEVSTAGHRDNDTGERKESGP